MKKKFKTNHLTAFNFNSPSIKTAFKEIREENKKILESRKVDGSRLNIRFDI